MNTTELIVDSFAGGGGASLGISWALGRGPDIAINHDREAIALHAANHPESRHFAEDVWQVDPVEATGGRPVGLMWLSPDCKHFSKAKGGKPVSKRVRGLAWVAVRWAKAVRPRVLVLENVEEFQTWGPVLDSGRPCPERKGRTFRHFIGRLRGLGYAVEWKELRACDFGTPTIRKRLFIIARCDGAPIVWPTPTHGKGRAQPWRTAAECIDWSIGCPSIFERQRPLAENTLKRIARGIRRFVIESPRPFIVPMQHANAPTAVDAPLQTITTQGNKFNLVTPFVAPLTHHGADRGQSVEEPLATVTGAHRGEQALVSPVLVNVANGQTTGRAPNTWPVEEPLRTLTASPSFAVVAPVLAGVGGRAGQSPERSVEAPYQTITAKADAALVAASLIEYHSPKREGDDRAKPVDEPVPTLDTSNRIGLTAALIVKHYSARANGGRLAAGADEPLPTVTARGTQLNLAIAHLEVMHGTGAGRAVDQPAPAVLAGGTHLAEVRAFLVAYYGNEKDGGDLLDPMRTLSTRDRFGLVKVDGTDYVIADIGMRMLAPRELYRAQGFPDSYRIDIPYNGKPMTKTAQVRMCGNSVCPPLAAAIIRANVGERAAAQVAA